MNLVDKLFISKVSKPTEMQDCLTIRYQVFVKGQQVPLDEEIDGLDPGSEHYLLYVDQQPVGTTRVRYLGDYAKIERVAILEQYQGQGLGHRLMRFVLDHLKQNPGITKAKLGAQCYAIPFYEKLGFVVCSEEYLDAGIPHKDMQLVLESANALRLSEPL